MKQVQSEQIQTKNTKQTAITQQNQDVMGHKDTDWNGKQMKLDWATRTRMQLDIADVNEVECETYEKIRQAEQRRNKGGGTGKSVRKECNENEKSSNRTSGMCSYQLGVQKYEVV